MRLHLKIENHTCYVTADLRKFFLCGMKQAGSFWCHLVVDYSKGGVHGWGTVNGSWVRMLLPREKPKENLVTIAQVFIHELGHNQGLRHCDMVRCSEINCDWASSYTIKQREIVHKERNLKQERYEKALLAVKLYGSRIKRSTTLLKKWERRVSYYQKTQQSPPAGSNMSKIEPAPA